MTILLLTSIAGFALEEEKNKGISPFIRIGYYAPTEEVFESGIILSVGGKLPLSGRHSVEMELLYFTTDTLNDVGVPVTQIGSGSLDTIGININLFYDWLQTGRFSSYLTGGFGYFLNSFEPTGEYSSVNLNIGEELDNCITFNAGLGFRYMLSGSMTLNLLGRYTFATAEGTWSIGDGGSSYILSSTSETKLDSLSLSLGLEFGL